MRHRVINAAINIKNVNTATAIAATTPALRPLPEPPGVIDGVVVSVL